MGKTSLEDYDAAVRGEIEGARAFWMRFNRRMREQENVIIIQTLLEAHRRQQEWKATFGDGLLQELKKHKTSDV
jgi:hypothetical protein